MTNSRAAARVRTALGAGALAFWLGLGCEPREIYLFDREPLAPRVDAGASAPRTPEPKPADEPSPEPEPALPPPADVAPSPALREQPACSSSACDDCVEQSACAVAGASLFCHPQTAKCSLACDPEAPARASGNCPAAESCEPRLGLCVECVSSADCAGALPVCDRQRNVCVECEVAADCPLPGQLCLQELQRCVQCRDDLDCRGQDDAVHCLPGEQRCVECVADRDCTTDPQKPLCSLQNECEDQRDDGGGED